MTKVPTMNTSSKARQGLAPLASGPELKCLTVTPAHQGLPMHTRHPATRKHALLQCLALGSVPPADPEYPASTPVLTSSMPLSHPSPFQRAHRACRAPDAHRCSHCQLWHPNLPACLPECSTPTPHQLTCGQVPGQAHSPEGSSAQKAAQLVTPHDLGIPGSHIHHNPQVLAALRGVQGGPHQG